jgi:hypothetical protein
MRGFNGSTPWADAFGCPPKRRPAHLIWTYENISALTKDGHPYDWTARSLRDPR